MQNSAAPEEQKVKEQAPPRAQPSSKKSARKDSPADMFRSQRSGAPASHFVSRGDDPLALAATAPSGKEALNSEMNGDPRKAGEAGRHPDETMPKALSMEAFTHTPLSMLGAAVDKGADPATLDMLMGLYEREERARARRGFEEAMAEARAEIPTIKKNRRAPGGRGTREAYRHEDLGEIARTINPILARLGLSYRFRTSSLPNEPISVTCIISHHMGHFEENTLHGPRDESGDKNGIQAIGSTITYLQRYTLKAALGLAAAHDDDGAASGGAAAADDPITDAQLEQLTSLLDQAGADSRKFCAYFGIDALGELRQSRLREAVAALQAKRKKQAGQVP